jgi:hypothetical protein
MPGAHRTRSLACKVKIAHERSHHRYSRIHPAFPHAMVLTVSFVLSPVTGLSCHRRRADRSAKLDTSVGASGPHDFAVRDPSTPKASTGLVPVRRSFSEGGTAPFVRAP